MSVGDLSGWLSYLVDGPNAQFFVAPIGGLEELLVPSITLAGSLQECPASDNESDTVHIGETSGNLCGLEGEWRVTG